MLPSIYVVILATLSLTAVPEAARVTERKRRALEQYDAQSNVPFAVTAKARKQRWIFTVVGLIAAMTPVLFVFATPAAEFGPFLAFIRAHTVDSYVLGLFCLGLQFLRDNDAELVCRTSDKRNQCLVVPMGQVRSIPYASLSLALPSTTIKTRVHGSVLCVMAVASIICGLPTRGLAVSILSFYCACDLMSRTPMGDRSGKASYRNAVLGPLYPLCFSVGYTVVTRAVGSYLESGTSQSSTPAVSALDSWGMHFVDDRPIGDIIDLLLTTYCAFASVLSVYLTTMAYRYDVSQALESAVDEAQKLPTDVVHLKDSRYSDSEDSDRVSSPPSSRTVDAHGRKPVPFASISVPYLSTRQAPTFTASLVSLAVIHISFLLAFIASTRSPNMDEDGIVRPENIVKMYTFVILFFSFPLVAGAALVSASIFSPSGAKGLWTYTEQWSMPSSSTTDEETQARIPGADDLLVPASPAL